MSKKLGYFAHLLVGAQGTTLTSADEIKLVTNITGTGSLEAIDATDRNTGGWKSYLAGLKDYQLEGTMHWDNANEKINLFREAFMQHKPIAIFANDGNGGGIEGDFLVTQWKENQQNNAPLSYDFTLQINADSRVPVLYAPAATGTTGTAIENVEF